MCGTNATSNKKPASRLLSSTVAGVAVAFAGLVAGPAVAQDDSPSESVLEEILVTAQKRVQTLQDVPSSVSAITGEAVREYLGAAENIRAMANRVPSLNIESSNGRTQPRLYIRGQGNIDFDNNASQPVGMVFDEIFLENNVLRSLPLFDIERVEVLAGPQGSLFGRNTNAGLVKIDSVRPSFERQGYVSVSYGQRETAALEFAYGDQLADNAAWRLSLKGQRRSDWIDNAAAGTSGDDFGAFDEFAYRLQFLVEGDEGFNGLFKVHGFHQSGSQPQVFYANGLEPGKKGVRKGFNEEVARHDGGDLCAERNIPGCAGMELDHIGFAANLSWDVGDFTFTSVTGYDAVENFQSTDVDGGVLDFNIGELGSAGFFSTATGDGLDDHEQVTQEFRLALDTDDSFWQLGVYLLNDDIDIKSIDFLGCCDNPGATDIVRQKTDSLALFGQGEINVSDRLAVTVGARVTSDDKKLSVIPGFNSVSSADTIAVDDTFGSWDIALTYDMSDEWSWYARIANASRGPVTLGRFGVVSSAKTETTNSVEVGFKSVLMDGRARWNTSLYSFTNDDQQLTATGGVANVNQLLNADKVNGQGIETSFEWLVTDNFLLLANASYNDTEIDDADLRDDLCGASPACTPLDPIVGTRPSPFPGAPDVTEVSINGNPLPRTPEWTYNLILQYSIPVDDGEFYINTDWNYRDDANLFLHESIEFVADSRVLGGLRIGYRTDNLDAALVGRNITDEISVDGGINFNNLTIFINEPAFWGIEMRYDF